MTSLGRKLSGFTLTLCLLLPWLTACSTPQKNEPPKPLETAFANALKRFQAEFDLPGITASYVLPNAARYSAAAGWADIEQSRPMTVESRMLAASIGKSFVAATMVSLAREQTIDLDVPVSYWLGRNSWFQRLPNHRSMTLRQLLNHTSGLPNHVYLPSFAASVSKQWNAAGNPFTPEVLVSFVLDSEQLFPAGEGWAYSDTGYILVGLVIEAITGRTYYQVLSDRFLGPLDLASTSPSSQRSLPGLAAGYVAGDNPFGFPGKTTDENGVMVWHPGLEWTGGGLISTSSDLARWGDALFSGNALADQELKTMLNAVPIDPTMPGIYYGLGVAISRSGPLSPVYGHGAWIPGYSSSLRHYVTSGITIAFQVNSDLISQSALSEIEQCLASVVISSGQNTACIP